MGRDLLEVLTLRGRGSRVSVAALLQTLRDLGMKSLMVEGGAGIIGSLLAKRDVVDALIITIAPVLVGGAGVGYDYPTTAAGDGALRVVQRFGALHTEIVVLSDTVVVLPPAAT
ncbi:hypothetical protein BDN70DRAFT_926778 [Pholiota conissans]|uniref:2,5-diamino-6-ribosylamino-4(3H)-pyrimidinone 5'-phosphate reductase n=1 Tax=Pholiota conissans TaxID=109636 RepID=A0A9P6D0P4_9AGAR|nr:hypothetical protein BDN70DRAFT_926778 [Pholiota conissans]